MKLKEAKEAWKSVGGRWWDPLSFILRVFGIAYCACGLHSYETFREGRVCVWCGHRWASTERKPNEK